MNLRAINTDGAYITALSRDYNPRTNSPYVLEKLSFLMRSWFFKRNGAATNMYISRIMTQDIENNVSIVSNLVAKESV